MKLFLYALISFFSFSINIQAFSSKLCPRKLKSSWEPYEPIQFRDKNGIMTGFDVEVVNMLFGKLGCEVEYRRMSWPRAIRSVASGHIDFVLGATLLKEREKFAYFTTSYRSEVIAIFVREDKLAKWKSIKSLKDMNQQHKFYLGVTDSYSYGVEIDSFLKNYRYKTSAMILEKNLQKLAANRIDGILSDYIVMAEYLKMKPLLDQATGEEIKLVRHPLKIREEPVHLMISKKNFTEEQFKEIDSYLKKILATKSFKNLKKKYFKI